MRLNLVRSTVVVSVAAFLLLVASPTLAAAFTNCTRAPETSPCPQGAAIPLHSSHCALTNTEEVPKQVISPNRLTKSENVDLYLSPTNLPTESSPNQERPFQGDTVQASPPSPLIEYHCRNSPDSEEPPL